MFGEPVDENDIDSLNGEDLDTEVSVATSSITDSSDSGSISVCTSDHTHSSINSPPFSTITEEDNTSVSNEISIDQQPQQSFQYDISSSTATYETIATYKIVEDNVDKNIKPRYY